jgi:dihydroorotase
VLKNYVISYDGFGIQVEAETIEEAKKQAFISFKKFYPAPVAEDKFMSGINKVREF